MSFRLGLQLASVATTMGAGDPFVPTNLDFIDWETRGAEFVAVNGRSAEKIRQDYHALFETGLLDPFIITFAFAGVSFPTCFIPMTQSQEWDVENSGFVVGNHTPISLNGIGSAFITTGVSVDDVGSTVPTESCYAIWSTEPTARVSGAARYIIGASTNRRFGGIVVTSSDYLLWTRFGSGAYEASTDLPAGFTMVTSDAETPANVQGIVGGTLLTSFTAEQETHSGSPEYRIFNREGTVGSSLAKLSFAGIGDSVVPNPEALKNALNDLFITKMGITI
jgi:hypothetical protein